MMRKLLAGAVGLVLVPALALAQTALTWSDLSTTLSTAAINCVPASSSRKTLSIANPNTVNMGFCYSANTSAPCVPSIGTVGTWTIAPGTLFFWPSGSAPLNSMSCILASGSGFVSIATGQ